MKVIEKLSKQIKEELQDSEKYIRCAMNYAADNKELAEMYYTLACEEMAHSDKLHKAVVREIEKFKATGKEVPPAMQAIWTWQHEQIIEESIDIKVMLEMYKK
ncbi:MAG: hypothetical protein RR444_11650 [Oscillospiraceae bacterium]